ncbi:Hsp20/alpha crystallin family protein [Bacillus timonensis]|nr:Hsp20/alpha crystallin family protein [Bacillus timonensis]
MKRNQFRNMQDWKKQWDNFFGEEFWSGFEPLVENANTQVNMYQAENELLVVFSLPGLRNVDDVQLYTQYQTLEIRGKIHLKFKDFQIIEEGIFQGKFERVIQLPFPVKEDRVDAKYRSGLLIVHLHRLIPDENRRKITVEQED